MARIFAYVRVSATELTVENQIHEIEARGFAVEPHRIVVETVTGATCAAQRLAFIGLLERLEPGDVLVVTKVDRLGRNAIDIMQTVARLEAAGVRVHCLQLGGADLTSPAGKMIVGVLAIMAQFERDLIIERTRAGLARAKAEQARGVMRVGRDGRMRLRIGRQPVLSAAQRDEAMAALAAGVSISKLARRFGVSRATVMRARRAEAVNDNAD